MNNVSKGLIKDFFYFPWPASSKDIVTTSLLLGVL